MNPTLRQLLDLQAIDTEYMAVQRRLKAGPREVDAKEKTLAEARAALAAKQAECTDLQAAADAAGLEMKSAEADIDRLKQKLNSVKNNKEYNLVRGAISEADRRREKHETESLEILEQIDARQKEAAALEEAVQAAEAELQRVQDEVAADEAELRPQADAIKARRKALAAEVPPEDLAVYEEVIRAGRGVALSKMVDGACQGCFVQPSPNIENQVLVGRELVRCPGCKRFLYPDEDGEGGA